MAVLNNNATVGVAAGLPSTAVQAAVNPAAQVAAPAAVSPNSAYGIQARQALNNMGVDSQRIKFTNGYVTVDGKNIFKPGVVSNGTSFVNQDMVNKAQDLITQLNSANRLNTLVTNPTPNPYDSQITTQLNNLNQPLAANPYDNQVSSALEQLMQRINNPTPYDPYSSAEYAAANAATQRGAQQSTRAAQESLGASGFGRSTNLADRAQTIQNDANEYMQLQIIPQLISANQAQQQQGIANLYSMVNALAGQQGVRDTRAQNERSNQFNILDALTGQQGVTDTRTQNTFNNTLGVEDYINKLAQQGIENNRADKTANLNAADVISRLTGRVVSPQTDWTGLIRQANNPNTPLTADQQNTQFNQNLDMEKLKEDTRRFGLNYALEQQGNQISAQNANTSRASATNSANSAQFNQLMDVWQATGKAPSGLESFGVSPGTAYTTGAAAKAAEPKTYKDYQSEIEKVVASNTKNPAVAQDYIKSLPISNYEKYTAWIASGYEWPSNVEVPKQGE